jgi:putative ABC transport system substrate-binding protein
VVVFLSAAPLETDVRGLAEFRKGLSEIGYVEGQNVMIEYRSANGQADRLPALAADMVQRRVAVIATMANNAAVAAKATTTTIPIVFTVGGDPIKMGLVDSLNRPGGNITGVSFLSSDIVTKMLEALHELMPKAERIAALVNPTNQNAAVDTKEAEAAARALGLELQVLKASNTREIDDAFALLVERPAAALLIEGDPFFIGRMRQLVVLTARHAIPAIYQSRDFPEAGGLMSYGASRSDALRLAGGPDPQGRATRRPAGAVGHETRVSYQSQHCQGVKARHSADAARTGRRGDRMRKCNAPRNAKLGR